MRQVYHNLCTYSADLFGINSALYELGGLIVMHDASGCNSTYNTHDEPRWYTMDSMVYVSGLNEKDAILGNDQKIIDDICAVAEKEHPKFIVLSLSVLPAYMGTDVRGIARLIEKQTGIPSFGFATNGMDTYVRGAGMAFRAIAERFCPAVQSPKAADGRYGINLLGVTPLDFSVNGNVEALEQSVRDMGFRLMSSWAMGCTLEQLQTAPQADVNLVVSVTGLPAAEFFYETYGIPYVTGFACGEKAGDVLRGLLKEAIRTKQNSVLTGNHPDKGSKERIRLIGEPVHCASLRFYLEEECGNTDVRILCPMEEDAGMLRDTDVHATGEAEIAAFLNEATIVVADPIYRRITENEITFIDDPHDAYSGRMYHNLNSLFVGKQQNLFKNFALLS